MSNVVTEEEKDVEVKEDMSAKTEVQLSNQELQDKMRIIERMYHGEDDFLGCNALTTANKTNSPRTMMLSNHLPQAEHCTYAENPRWYSNYETAFGRYSSSLKIAGKNYTVVDKISKFTFDGNEDVQYVLVVKDNDTEEYDIMTKREYEKLTENHGYSYNTDVIDSLEVGDVIPEGKILSKSSNFDEYNNYMYGVNALCALVIDENTIEDSIECSESFAKKGAALEVDNFSISLNDNDILLNLFGDNEEYKTFPDIGESAWKQIICCKRRLNKSTMMYDLKYDRLREIDFGNDTLKICNGKVVDIDIYCNKPLEELPEDKVYYNQIRKYYEESLRYNGEIIAALDWIVNNATYTIELSKLYQRACNVLNNDVKWEHEGGIFSNIVINFTVVNESPLTVGSKLSGWINQPPISATV